jgi:hypothetical protein
MDVATDMLDVFGAEMLAGRRFAAGDAGATNAGLRSAAVGPARRSLGIYAAEALRTDI